MSCHHNLAPPPPLVITAPRRYRTLCYLPVELFTMIIDYIPNGLVWSTTIRSCTLACRHMRPVALTSYFRERMFLNGITSFDHPLSFLRANPRVCQNITRLKLEGELRNVSRDKCTTATPLDDAMVSDILELLHKVEYLDLHFFVYVPSAPNAQVSTSPNRPSPRGLKRCEIQFGHWQKDECDSSLPGLFRILSLFPSIDELRIWDGACKFGTSPPLDLPVLLRPPIEVKSVSFRECRERDLESLGGTLRLVDALRAITQPGTLSALEVRCSSAEEVVAVGELIAHARGALTSLDVGAEALLPPKDGPKEWQDPLDDHWQKLNLELCPKLDTLQMHIHFRDDPTDRAPRRPQQDQNVSQLEEDASRLDEDESEGESMSQPKDEDVDEDMLQSRDDDDDNDMSQSEGDDDMSQCENEDVSQLKDRDMSRLEDEDVPQPADGDVLQPSRAAIGMLSQVSSSVRDITIRLHDLPPALSATMEMIKQGRLLGLQAFDEAITKKMFPRVSKVHLHVHFQPSIGNRYMSELREIHRLVWVHMLPKLDTAEVLDFGFKVREQPYSYFIPGIR